MRGDSFLCVRRLFYFLISWGEFSGADKSCYERFNLENVSPKNSKKAILKREGIIPSMNQTSFFKNQTLFHGGELALGKRKEARTLCSKRTIHLILKSNKPVLRANKDKVEKATRTYAKRLVLKSIKKAFRGITTTYL